MHNPPRISIIIPTLNAASDLPRCLDGLLPGVETGVIHEVILSDGGSTDATANIAEDCGAKLVSGTAGRGGQLGRGALQAKGDWLLFLHADTVLDPDWPAAVAAHMQNDDRAAVFRLAFRASGPFAKGVAGWANLRTSVFGLPYGDQGLLMSHALYTEIGGYSDLPLMEDVDIVRRLKGRFVVLPCRAHTGAERYLREGWLRRGARNLLTLARYLTGTPVETLARFYQKS